jgi:spore germination protein (amino acid permease)
VEKKIVFGSWEASCYIIVSICTQIFLNFPRVMAESAATAGWLLTIYVSIISIILLAIILKLYRPFDGKDLIDIGEYVAGKTGRIIVGLVLIAHFGFIVTVILREFSEDVKIISFSLSPLSFISFFFLIGMVIGAYFGIEAIVRFSAIVVPIIAVAFLLIIIGVLGHADFSGIFPVLGNGPYELFIKGLQKISIFSGMIVLFMLSPFLKTFENYKKSGYWGAALSAVFLTLGALFYQLVYSYPTSMENFLPFYQLARLVRVGRFFERGESVFLIAWVISAFIYLSSGLFFIVYFFKKVFKLEYHRPIILPFAILIFNLSFLPPNLVSAIELESKVFRNIAWVVTFGMTIVLLLLARLKKKRKNKGGEDIAKQKSK